MPGGSEAWDRDDWRHGLDKPLTPVEIEARLRGSITLLTRAQQQLRAARDAETEAEIAYKSRRYRATLQAPKPERGGVTVGERDAWVEEQSHEAWAAYRRAETVREAAQDHLRTVRDVVEVLRSLGASVRTAYDGAGYDSGRR